MRSPHEVLGVDEDAGEAEVTRAYKRRVKEAHPDHGGSREAFQRVRAAYEALREASRPGDDGSGHGGLADATAAGANGPTKANGTGTPGGTGVGTRRRSATPANNGTASEPRTATATDQKTTVEYLDYEVLADHGWDLDDEDLFAKAAAADLGHEDYGRFVAEPGETLLAAAEERGFAWPFACRGAACANCAVLVAEGDLEMPSNHVLPEELLDRGIQLSCVGVPATEELRVVFNIKHLPELEELRLPPTPFRRQYPDR